MDKMNIFIPQWQGSGAHNNLFYGAHAIKEFIEKNKTIEFEQIYINEKENTELRNNIIGYEILNNQLKNLEQTLYKKEPKRLFTIGGGCEIEIPIVSYLNEKYKDLTLFWYDAHGDLNSPKSSKSKLFHGMPLRFLTDPNISSGKIKINKINSKNINLLGTRDLDRPEREYIEENNIRAISVEEIRNKDDFKSAIKSTSKNRKAYIHIDLDVLDPQYYKNVKCPTNDGLSIEELITAIQAIIRQFDIVGFSIVENTETDLDKIKKLEEIIEIGSNI